MPCFIDLARKLHRFAQAAVLFFVIRKTNSAKYRSDATGCRTGVHKMQSKWQRKSSTRTRLKFLFAIIGMNIYASGDEPLSLHVDAFSIIFILYYGGDYTVLDFN